MESKVYINGALIKNAAINHSTMGEYELTAPIGATIHNWEVLSVESGQEFDRVEYTGNYNSKATYKIMRKGIRL